jgi:hypothetical protein
VFDSGANTTAITQSINLLEVLVLLMPPGVSNHFSRNATWSSWTLVAALLAS